MTLQLSRITCLHNSICTYRNYFFTYVLQLPVPYPFIISFPFFFSSIMVQVILIAHLTCHGLSLKYLNQCLYHSVIYSKECSIKPKSCTARQQLKKLAIDLNFPQSSQRRKEQRNSHKLPSDLHIGVDMNMCVEYIHKHSHTQISKYINTKSKRKHLKQNQPIIMRSCIIKFTFHSMKYYVLIIIDYA